MRIHAQTDPGQTLKSQKVEFLDENILKIGHKTYIRRYKSLFERQENKFISKISSISMLLDPDPHSKHTRCVRKQMRRATHLENGLL